MSEFKAKMHQNRFWLGLSPRPRRGSLQRSPSHPTIPLLSRAISEHFKDEFHDETLYKSTVLYSTYFYRLCRVLAPQLSPFGPLRPNVTSSTKPEVHNVSQRRRRRIELRPQGIGTQNFVMMAQWYQRYARGQRDRHTDGRSPTRGRMSHGHGGSAHKIW